ncbi:S-adenosyl-L-methionine-dependent methyltransferase [Rhypophila decipiens]|uniref:S-adenosyl-L-methionine-dependent methyltransferase n=1 Tax=Rhypophila decipiens TaxID=261697 RepID=A0AAN6XWG8_9PEZI|nr:S-adenosyl-L-methionine-dependent methyltransferase [Rhypophila decipiens]
MADAEATKGASPKSPGSGKSSAKPGASPRDTGSSPPPGDGAEGSEPGPGELVAAEHFEDEESDTDSRFGGDAESSTASVSSSILEYRKIHGRTFHSDRYDSQYWTPNDERQSENVDITHHYMTLLLDDRLYLAPIRPDVQKVLDIGTGTGIWAIDFGDQHPSAEVIGTDLSPMMPAWVPPNVRFEIDDCTKPWTWDDNSVDFVHIRFLGGGIKDWTGLFREAYRVLKPGGWLQSGEFDPRFLCDDGTGNDQEAFKLWNKVFNESGPKMGVNFAVIDERIQDAAIVEAGFEKIEGVTYKAPVGPWPRDKKLAEAGRYVQLVMENDMEGYSTFLWNTILGWPAEEYQVFLMQVRKMVRDWRKTHNYFHARYVWGRKPE